MKKKKSHKKKIIRRQNKKSSFEGWVMPFDATFPGGEEYEFDFEPQDKNLAVLFQYGGNRDEEEEV